jgi:TPR repeat protein
MQDPDNGRVWALRAAVALELDEAEAGWEAGRNLLRLGYGTQASTGPLFASLERKGWMEEKSPRADFRALICKAEGYLAQKELTNAIATAELACRKETNAWESYDLLARAHLQNASPFASEFYAREASSRAPANVVSRLVTLKLEAQRLERRIKTMNRSEHWFTVLCYETVAERTERNYFDRRDIAEVQRAIAYYKPFAEKGNTHAQNNLGAFLLQRKDSDKDQKEAVKWFARAVKFGDPLATCNLGCVYRDGLAGTQKNYGEALELFNKAASLGFAGGHMFVADMYCRGLGVQKNIVLMAEHYHDAAVTGYVGSYYYEGFCYKDGVGRRKDYFEAQKWYLKTLDSGFGPNERMWAFLALARLIETGAGCVKDPLEAKHWYEQAADLGSDEAKQRLATFSNATAEPMK